ncbi:MULTISPECIES: hypothetical protein [Arthrobacter]|jgi:hypothetical protein|uniref:Uncharacterized protein n=1 Tax=Arthrobacter crusticola TaxID=2547960 RepID=A0A4R5TVY6_9MICC|nr:MULTISPECIES: hypothetical protein [Arthrobacter]MBJ2121864.1 hypothetical protein [Arthrobacter sp. MSA 4-2]RJU02481.1 hypothetical protein D6T65_07830 [Arthrobacter frigidicola]TDK25286.1 hypothetical protein E2F48_08375 [Arthrobacter crusticola]
MSDRSDFVIAADDRDLTVALGCSAAALASLRDSGVLASSGELWEVGPARDYLRDAAWADSLWH